MPAMTALRSVMRANRTMASLLRSITISPTERHRSGVAAALFLRGAAYRDRLKWPNGANARRKCSIRGESVTQDVKVACVCQVDFQDLVDQVTRRRPL